jgi:hypothetical protein
VNIAPAPDEKLALAWLAGDDLDEAEARWAVGQPARLRAGGTWNAVVCDLVSGRDALTLWPDWPSWVDAVAGTVTFMVPPNSDYEWHLRWGAGRTGALHIGEYAEVLVPSPTGDLWCAPLSRKVAPIGNLGEFLAFDPEGRHREVSRWHLDLLADELRRRWPDAVCRIIEEPTGRAEATLLVQWGPGPAQQVAEVGVRLDFAGWWVAWSAQCRPRQAALQARSRVAVELACELGGPRP